MRHDGFANSLQFEVGEERLNIKRVVGVFARDLAAAAVAEAKREGQPEAPFFTLILKDRRDDNFQGM